MFNQFIWRADGQKGNGDQTTYLLIYLGKNKSLDILIGILVLVKLKFLVSLGKVLKRNVWLFFVTNHRRMVSSSIFWKIYTHPASQFNIDPQIKTE